MKDYENNHKDGRRILGGRGEKAAIAYLGQSGYQIITRNLKLGSKEIDIIARQGVWTVFIEVKTREYYQNQDRLVSPRQLKNLKQALLAYAVPRHLSLERLRLDLIFIKIKADGQSASLSHYRDLLN